MKNLYVMKPERLAIRLKYFAAYLLLAYLLLNIQLGRCVLWKYSGAGMAKRMIVGQVVKKTQPLTKLMQFTVRFLDGR